MEYDMLIIFPRPWQIALTAYCACFLTFCFICFSATVTVEPGLCWKWQIISCFAWAKLFPPWSRECVYLLTPRQGHSLARDTERKKRREPGRGRKNGGRAVEEWKSKGICNANGCPATLNNSKCWMEILLFWSPVINFCRSGPFSFGLFWPARLPFCTTATPPHPPPVSLTHPLPLYFCSHPLYLFVFLETTFPCLFIETLHACCPPCSPLRSSLLISRVASFLPNSLKKNRGKKKRGPTLFLWP